jgi:hypothetical protein
MTLAACVQSSRLAITCSYNYKVHHVEDALYRTAPHFVKFAAESGGLEGHAHHMVPRDNGTRTKEVYRTVGYRHSVVMAQS